MTDAKKDSVPQSPDGEGKRFLRDRCGRRSIPFKPRQNRQAMQSKVRPLKQWLIRHRDDPYPSKRDKEILARESDMALPQVSTWFANARRRLKKVVQGDDISWSARVELYNSHVDGNAELLSLSSDDSFNEMDDTEDEPISDVTASCKSSTSSATQQNSTSHSTSYMTSQSHMTHETPGHMDDVVVPSRSQTPISSPSFSDCFDNDLHSAFHRPVRHSMFDPGTQGKHKQIILQRYLNDLAHSPSSHGIDMELSAFNKTRSRNPSGSVGSRDYEEMSTASGISSTDGHHHAVFDESGDDLEIAARRRHISGDDSIQLKEISAVMALTSLARSRKNPHT